MKIRRSISHYYFGLFILDLLVWVIAFISAFWVRHPNQFPTIPTPYLNAMPYALAILSISFRYFGLYSKKFGYLMEVIQLLKAGLIALCILLTLSFFYREYSYSRIAVVSFVVIAFCLNSFSRQIYRLVVKNILKSIRWQHPILIVGGGEVGKKLIDEFLKHTTEYQVIGFLDDKEFLQHSNYQGVPCMGKVADLKVVIDRNEIDEVIIAFPSAPKELYKNIMYLCAERDIKCRFVPKLFKIMLQDIAVDILGDVPLVGVKGNNLTGFNYMIKRAFDIVVSLTLLIILAPLMILVAVLIKIFSPGPVFYTQERFGYKKQSFKFYKFRSMHHNSDDSVHKEYVEKWINNNQESELKDGDTTVHKLTDDSRIIPVLGTFIRKYSIDELPQLFNALIGDMSLVGPRPCLRYEMNNYKAWHKARFDVLPGITGLWQVSGRNRLSFEEMVRLDISYLQNWSFEKDLFIILKTPFIILFDKAY